jgi:hypothetical protein
MCGEFYFLHSRSQSISWREWSGRDFNNFTGAVVFFLHHQGNLGEQRLLRGVIDFEEHLSEVIL